MKTGLLSVTFDLQLAWRDPGLSVCNCLGNPVRTEYQMDAKLNKKIWTPRLHLLGNIFIEDNYGRGLMVEDHEDAVEIFQNHQITARVDCDFSKHLETYPFGETTCLIQVEEKDEPLSWLKFNTTLTSTQHTLNKLNSGFNITKRALFEEEQMNVPDFSRSGEYHSCTGQGCLLFHSLICPLVYLLVHLCNTKFWEVSSYACSWMLNEDNDWQKDE